MCKLSCTICEGTVTNNTDNKFRTIDQLKSHLFHRHHKIMCVLCLEGRKIFVSEQKLYTRPQLDRHIVTGDSEVDGSEMDRGGFEGHPMCEFCKKRFYGESELHSHMSSQHYTCHICQRQHPGEYEYYRNYDDLEVHFRVSHFLCENEVCVEKKFVVFVSESELKRHDALEHGGSMSRAKRNAALKIPTSFRYERSSVQGGRGRGRGRQNSSGVQGGSEETSMFDDTSYEPAFRGRSEGRDIDEIVAEPPVLAPPPIESASSFPPLSIASTDSQGGSAGYRQAAVSRSRNVALEQSFFPPLPGASSNIVRNVPVVNRTSRNVLLAQSASTPISSGSVIKRQKPKKDPGSNTRASPLRQNKNEPSPNSTAVPIVGLASSYSSQGSLTSNHGPVSSSISASSSQPKPAVTNVGSFQAPRPAASPSSSSSRVKGPSMSSPAEKGGSLDSSMLSFPPISAPRKIKESPPKSEPKEEDVFTTNSSLCEKIRSALKFDEDNYSTFKGLSEEYRQGVIGAGEYLSYVQQFDLSHLVLDLARLFPDPQKQRDLLDKYNASVRSDSTQENGLSISSTGSSGSSMSKKGKGKSVKGANTASNDSSSAGGGAKQQKKTSNFHGLQLVLSAGSGSASSGTTSTSVASRKSAQMPNHVERRGSLDSSLLDFPPISAPKQNQFPESSESKMEDNVNTANNTLWENIRSALELDEDKYTAFRGLSVEYVEGVIGAGEYLFYVQQFGLSHLVLELVRLCPDSQKQRELLDTHNANVLSNNKRESDLCSSATSSKGSRSSNKGKTKKTPKLHKLYLGNDYEQQSEHKDVWLNNGGQKLVSLTQI